MRLIEVFREFQGVFGICPCCGRLFRLSDARVFVGRPPHRSVFDEIQDAQRAIDRAVERFEAKESRIRALARKKGEAAARQRLRRIAKAFVAHRIDPSDVKIIFDPVEYIVFRGHTRGACSRVQFLDRSPHSARKERILNSLDKALDRGDVDWRTYRICETGQIAVES